MATSVLTPARALRRPRRLDARAVVGAFLLVLATGASLVFWARANDARPVVVATRDLPVGATLAAADLAVARVRLDEALYAAALPGDALDGLVGRQLAEPVHAGQLLVPAQVAGRPRLGPGQVAVAIPVAAPSAVGGRLRPGDPVRVVATRERGKPESRTEVVVDRALVHDVGYDERAPVLGGGGDERARRGPIATLTLVVDDATSLRLANARWNAELDVVLLPADG